MKRSKNSISERAAVELLKRIFGDTAADSITIQEIYVTAGRAELEESTNRNWLNNVMTKLRHHNLIAPDYIYGDRKKLVGLKLTLAGKTALGRSQAAEDIRANKEDNTPEVTYNDVAQAVKVFRDKNPEYDVVFSVTLKGATMQK